MGAIAGYAALRVRAHAGRKKTVVRRFFAARVFVRALAKQIRSAMREERNHRSHITITEMLPIAEQMWL